MSVHTYNFVGMTAVYASPAMIKLLEAVQRFARVDEAVLIEGESGSGKEIVARAIHHYSSRASRALVDINCAALPENLLESELFGYEKGAFSGADTRKPGIFELAQNGTLFLDEIGELDLKLQAKLLRVLDSFEFFRLGGTQKVRVDARIVVATNQDLERAVLQKRFRQDLYYRLAQLRVVVPPLRDRPEDILPIAALFRARYHLDADFSAEAQRALLHHNWPGNLRELRNVVIGCAANTTGDEIPVEDLPAALQNTPGIDLPTSDLLNLSYATAGEPDDQNGPKGLLYAAEKMLIMKTLSTTGNYERAASMLGISSRTLTRKLKAYNSEPMPSGEAI